jgi:hypothetical protein
MQRCGFDENGWRSSSAKDAIVARRAYGEWTIGLEGT